MQSMERAKSTYAAGDRVGRRENTSSRGGSIVVGVFEGTEMQSRAGKVCC